MEKSQRDKKIFSIYRQRKATEASKPKTLTPEQEVAQIKKWTTFYRRNISIYAEERLRIKLHPFQKIMLDLMNNSQIFFAICARGLSKTFIVGLFAVIKCLLYPYSEVVITASTLDQGGVMVRKKIEQELVNKLSPILKYMYTHNCSGSVNDKAMIQINTGKDEVSVRFFNGSTINVLPPIDSSRGNRATILIYEECRLLKKRDIDSIFDPMSHPRNTPYMQIEPYKSDPRLLEESVSIYITSARFKVEWFWTTFKNVVRECYTNGRGSYNFFAGDIYTSLKYGLKTLADWSKIQKINTDLDIRMEYLNEMVGETEDAYFSFELFRKNQVLHKAFRPPTSSEYNAGTELSNRKKKENEYRFIVVDLASANTVKGGEANDNTVIQCISGLYRKGNIVRSLEYLETVGGGESEKTVKRIRELYWDYQADYIIYDARTIGELYYNMLTKPYVHPERDAMKWNESGFTVANEAYLQVVADSKLDDLRQRTVDPSAIPCMIPVQASAEFNSIMWQTLKRTMLDGDIRFLIDDLDHQTEIEAKKWYLDLDSYHRMLLNLPFVQTSLLVHEGINLSPEWREGKLKLKESRSGTKDRMVALAYGNYIMSLLETKLAKADEVDEFSMDAWKGIFRM